MSDDPHGIDADDDDDDMMAELGSEPSLDAMLRNAMGGLSGWDGIENLGQLQDKLRRDQEKAMREEAALFRRVFNTPDGRKVLEIFLDKTVRQASWPWHALQTQDAMLMYGLAREAENGFVMAILKAVAHNPENVKGRDHDVG